MAILIWLAMITSVLLVLVVLAQNAKGGGLSSQFGGSSTSNLIGVKKTGDILERLTWGLAIALMVFSLATNLVGPSEDEILNRIDGERTTVPNQAIPQLQNSATPADTAK